MPLIPSTRRGGLIFAVTGDPDPPYGEANLTPAGVTGLDQAGGEDFAALAAASHHPAAL